MAKQKRDRTKAPKKDTVKDVEMTEAGEGSNAVAAPAAMEVPADPIAQHLAALSQVTEEELTRPRKSKKKGIQMVQNQTKKQAARGQRTKAQKLRKICKLEKALSASDRYVARSDKLKSHKEMKTLLSNLY